MTDEVLYDLDDAGVATLTLHRPDRANAYTFAMERALHARLDEVAADPAVRAVVLTGAGRSFCPGFDADVLRDAAADGVSPGGERPFTLLARVPKPVVCAINGACAGVGLVAALFCDVRLVARGARLSTSFARLGLPAERAAAWILPRIAGHAVALDLLLSARVFDADEAAALGVVHDVLEGDALLPAAVALATELATRSSPAALAAIKAQVFADWERSLEHSRRDADAAMLRLLAGPDFVEGVRAMGEKRLPRFAGYSGHLELGGSTS